GCRGPGQCDDRSESHQCEPAASLLDLSGYRRPAGQLEDTDFLSYYNNVVAFRTGITATLAKDPARASLVHAYDLGVNIAMAGSGRVLRCDHAAGAREFDRCQARRVGSTPGHRRLGPMRRSTYGRDGQNVGSLHQNLRRSLRFPGAFALNRT